MKIKSMDGKSLDDKMAELKKELVKINAQVAIGTIPKSPGHVRQVKKAIAKILTIQNINQKKAQEKPKEVRKKHG